MREAGGEKKTNKPILLIPRVQQLDLGLWCAGSSQSISHHGGSWMFRLVGIIDGGVMDGIGTGL